MSNPRKKNAYILIEILVAFSLVGITLTSILFTFTYNAKRQTLRMTALHDAIDFNLKFVEACLSIEKAKLSEDTRVSNTKFEETEDRREKMLVNIHPIYGKKVSYPLFLIREKNE